ncbi:hypothetical protein D049_2409A, partial [Vibrio parahaemolyticus VPTS-2010]
MLFYVV